MAMCSTKRPCRSTSAVRSLPKRATSTPKIRLPSPGTRSRCAITGGEKRFSPLVDPGEIGLLAMEEMRDGVYQHGVGRSGMETAGFFQGQDPLHPMIALVTGRAQQAL